MHPRCFAGASADFRERAHEFDQRRLDRRGKAPIELIESAFADDFAEQLPAPLFRRFAFCRELRQFLTGIDPREVRVCRRVVPGVAPRRRRSGIVRRCLLGAEYFRPFWRAGRRDRARHIL